MIARALVVAAFTLTLAWAPRAGAQESVALIWKGSKTKADVESLEPTWKQLETLLADGGVVVAKGFPTLVQSNTVRGLKPGFWVWVVGFCPADEGGRALELLKLVAPDAYSRDVKVPAKKRACPKTEEATLAADSHEFKMPEGRMLRVLTYEESSEPEGDEPGDAYTRTHYLFALTDKTGALLDTTDVVGEERFSGDVRNGPSGYTCHVSNLDRDKSGVVEFVRSCSATVAECGSVTSGDEVTRFTVSGDSLTRSELRRNEQRMECEAD